MAVDKKSRLAPVWFLDFFGFAFLSVIPAMIAFRFLGEMFNSLFTGVNGPLVLDLYSQSLKSFHFL